VDVSLTGPANAAQIDEALKALERGPVSDEELAWTGELGRLANGREQLPRSTSRCYPFLLLLFSPRPATGVRTEVRCVPVRTARNPGAIGNYYDRSPRRRLCITDFLGRRPYAAHQRGMKSPLQLSRRLNGKKMEIGNDLHLRRLDDHRL
jgi:hypothetical protein